ncbi:MAG: general secretion pathway protein GspB [Gammaproteobacteria bacterium]|nr:general secretion pathway protein GspB [Gammaproteobacteria bacterium]
MTYSAVSADVVAGRKMEMKPIAQAQVNAAPALPSASGELRNPFVADGHDGYSFENPGGGKGDAEANEELRLDGTVLAGSLRFAIINGTRVMEGDFFRGLKLEKVEMSQVRLVGGKQETVLPLGIAKSDTIRPVETAALERKEGGGRDDARKDKPSARPQPGSASKERH